MGRELFFSQVCGMKSVSCHRPRPGLGAAQMASVPGALVALLLPLGPVFWVLVLRVTTQGPAMAQESSRVGLFPSKGVAHTVRGPGSESPGPTTRREMTRPWIACLFTESSWEKV